MKEIVFKTLALKLINFAISLLNDRLQDYWDSAGEILSVENIKTINLKRLQYYQNLAFTYLDAKANLEDNKPLSKENYTTIHNLLQGSTEGVFDNDKQLEDFKTFNDNRLKELL
ncbi:MAG: hypothetical protein J6T10_19085 [Methanobrevibacter sp.]|nr:hypothetical protein [Methanobrevibacter sp.]